MTMGYAETVGGPVRGGIIGGIGWVGPAEPQEENLIEVLSQTIVHLEACRDELTGLVEGNGQTKSTTQPPVWSAVSGAMFARNLSIEISKLSTRAIQRVGGSL